MLLVDGIALKAVSRGDIEPFIDSGGGEFETSRRDCRDEGDVLEKPRSARAPSVIHKVGCQICAGAFRPAVQLVQLSQGKVN